MKLIALILVICSTLPAETIPVSGRDLNHPQSSLSGDNLVAFLEGHGFEVVLARDADIHGFGQLEKLGNVNKFTPEEVLAMVEGHRSLYLTGNVLWTRDGSSTARSGDVDGSGIAPSSVAAIPEPATHVLLATQAALLGIAVVRRRKS